MKIKKIKKEFYICDICKQEYKKKKDAVKCKEQHLCKHKHITYEFNNISTDLSFKTDGINLVCSTCGKIMHNANFTPHENNFNIKKSIYNIIKKYETT